MKTTQCWHPLKWVTLLFVAFSLLCANGAQAQQQIRLSTGVLVNAAEDHRINMNFWGYWNAQLISISLAGEDASEFTVQEDPATGNEIHDGTYLYFVLRQRPRSVGTKHVTIQREFLDLDTGQTFRIDFDVTGWGVEHPTVEVAEISNSTITVKIKRDDPEVPIWTQVRIQDDFAYWSYRKVASDEESDTYEFDLSEADASVFFPRFKKNKTFSIYIGLHTVDDGGRWIEADKVNKLFIPLPVVLVPGIDLLGGKDSAGNDFTSMQIALNTQSALKMEALKLLGTPYGDNASYPTLRTAHYPVNQGNLGAGASALRSLLADIFIKTWAGKVNLVAHSRGGLVARKYVQNGGGSSVAQLIMVQTPHMGTAQAAIDAITRYFGYGYGNLVPVYPWQWSPRLGQFIDDLKNPELRRLNGMSPAFNDPFLPITVDYIFIYSGGIPTLVAPRAYRGGDDGGDDSFWGFGDRIVPDFSQLARLYSPNDTPVPPEQLPFLPAFSNVPLNHIDFKRIDAEHSGAFDQESIQNEIFTRVFGSPQ